MSAILGAFPANYPADSALVNVVARAATDIANEAQRPRVMAKPAMGLTQWLASNDTGLSSRYMASVLADPPFKAEFNYPHDGSDFGRCYRMLRAVPELRANFDRLAQCRKPWPALHARWGELEVLYLEADREVYKRGGPNPNHDAFYSYLKLCVAS